MRLHGVLAAAAAGARVYKTGGDRNRTITSRGRRSGKTSIAIVLRESQTRPPETMTSSPLTVAFVCVAAFVLGSAAAAAVPAATQQQQEQQEDGGGLGTVLWSVLDDCYGGSGDPVVCLKTRALTALDRALVRPTIVLTDGVSLAARAGKAMQSSPLADPQTERADRAALDAADGPERKNALLDDMLVSRLDRLMSTRTIVLDGPVGEEGEYRVGSYRRNGPKGLDRRKRRINGGFFH